MSLDFSDDHILDEISSEQINMIKSDMEISNICKNLDEYKKNNRISWEIFSYKWGGKPSKWLESYLDKIGSFSILHNDINEMTKREQICYFLDYFYGGWNNEDVINNDIQYLKIKDMYDNYKNWTEKSKKIKYRNILRRKDFADYCKRNPYIRYFRSGEIIHGKRCWAESCRIFIGNKQKIKK